MVSQVEIPALNPTHTLRHTIAGLVQVFTCSQRSFFTGVIAQALRIAGQGTPVLVVQFLKGGIGQGQNHPMQLGQNLDWLRCDVPRCIDSAQVSEAESLSLRSLWDYTQTVVSQDKYSLVVLDELSLAISYGLISEAEVLAFLADRPPHIDVILTGPEMPPSILDVADQITELRRSHQP